MPLIRRESEGDDGIPMTPLIDIVFLLLIFFLVTASLRKPHKVLPVELPVVGGATTAQDPPQELSIFIDAQGNYGLSTLGPVTQQQLLKALNEQALKAPATRIKIQADRNARVQPLVQALHACEVHQLDQIVVRVQE